MVELRVSAYYAGSAKASLHACPAPVQCRKFDLEAVVTNFLQLGIRGTNVQAYNSGFSREQVAERSRPCFSRNILSTVPDSVYRKATTEL